MLRAEVEVGVGSLSLAIDLAVDAGEVVALLGPNGSGKTTTLRVLAGLQPIDAGRVDLDGVVLDDPAAGRFVEPADRRVGVVFQDLLLFPRLSVLDNVAFGPRCRGEGRTAARRRAREALSRLGLDDLASARPHELSGGQAQRVALARAIAPAPRLLLLDEPLSALDAGARVAVRTELRRNLREIGGPRLLVTHDPVDAAVLADRLVVVEDGRIVQSGPVEEVTNRPATRFVADLVGVNLVHGRTDDAHTVVLSTGARLTLADALPGPEVSVAIRPQAVALHAREPEGSPRNTWQAVVAGIETEGERVRVRLDGPVPVSAQLTPAAVSDLAIEPGSVVWASVKAVDLSAYER